MVKYKKLITLLVAIGLFQTLLTAIVPAFIEPIVKHIIENKGSASGIFQISAILRILLDVILWIPVAVWIYRDSKKETSSAWLWAMLVFIAHYQGVAIMLIVKHLVDKAPNNEVVADAANSAALRTS